MGRKFGRREFLKHGAVAGAIAATGLPAVTAMPVAPPLVSTPPVGAGDIVDSFAELADRQFDSQAFCLSVYDSLEPALAFSATDAAGVRNWQRAARARVIERLGGLPTTRGALNAEVLETKDFGSYTRERIVFQSRENLSVLGYLLLPKDRPRPLPVIVTFSGHGRGVDDILGIAPDGSQLAQRGVGYAREYGLQCVERGYATFAIEQLAFGARRDAAARKAGAGENSCRPAACAALMFGQTMIGWRGWDAMRAIDYLATRQDIDITRVATLGASGGGTTSLFTAALDERVKVSVVSAYFNTFRDSILSISHCPDNYVPGLATDMEMSDVAGLIAPRALFVESGRKDPIFPIAGSQRAADKAQTIFRMLGVADQMGYEIHEGAHEFHGVGAFDFLAKRL